MKPAGPFNCSDCGKTHPRGCRGHRSSDGEPCENAPITGSTVCRYHGGRAPQVQRAAARRIALEGVTREAARLGLSIDVDPAEALLELVHEAAANVAAYRLAVQELGLVVADDGGVAVPASFDDKGKRDPALAHILVGMYDAERDRLARFAKTALDAGIEERRVRLVEAQAVQLGEVVEAAVRALNPTPDQYREAVAAAARVMRRIGGGGA